MSQAKPGSSGADPRRTHHTRLHRGQPLGRDAAPAARLELEIAVTGNLLTISGKRDAEAREEKRAKGNQDLEFREGDFLRDLGAAQDSDLVGV